MWSNQAGTDIILNPAAGRVDPLRLPEAVTCATRGTDTQSDPQLITIDYIERSSDFEIE